MREYITTLGLLAIPLFIVFVIVLGLVKRVRVYEAFVEGAKEGFTTAVTIIPYLVAILFAIGMFRASGAMEVFASFVSPVSDLIRLPADVIPMAIVRPLSGSGSLGILGELVTTHGPQSYEAALAAVIFGSTETTFYVIAVYFGAVGVKNVRHAILVGLAADVIAIFLAIVFVNLLMDFPAT